jgi:nucleoside 2-deoxyribosyltransferase
MVDVKSTKEYQTVQTQTVETSTNEDNRVKNKKADPPGIELESDFFDDDVEFIDGCDVVVAAIPRRDHMDEDDDVEFIVSSKEIEAEMKAAGLF